MFLLFVSDLPDSLAALTLLLCGKNVGENLAETWDWLCTEQAGFRKNRSCEDKILRLTKSISDGYQATKPKKTVLVLLDYSKAFDRVWREDLLFRAIDKGLQISYVQWLRDFLSNVFAT